MTVERELDINRWSIVDVFKFFNGGTDYTIANAPHIPLPQNPYTTTDIQYRMWEQNLQSASETRGNVGYVLIKNRFMTETYNDGDVLAFSENGTNLTVYLHRSPYFEGGYGVSWTDNDQKPDEHIWKIEVLSITNLNDRVLSITNTAYPEKPLLYYYYDNDYKTLAENDRKATIVYKETINTTEHIYNINSHHLAGGPLFARQTAYNVGNHGGYGAAQVYTAGDASSLHTDTQRDWSFQFIKSID